MSHTQIPMRPRTVGRLRIRMAFPGIAGAWITLLTLILQGQLLPALSVGVFAFCFFWYIEALGRELAIVPVVAVIASAQWLFGPYLAYTFDLVTLKYFMYVEASTYFSFALPCIVALVTGLYALAPTIMLDDVRRKILTARRIPDKTVYLIFAAGFVSDYVAGFAPSALSFAFFLVSQAKFIAIAYMLILRVRWRWWAIALAFLSLTTSSLESGLFHTVLLWSALVLSFVTYEFRLSRSVKIVIMLIMSVAVMQLQATKSQYREAIYSGERSAGVGTFTDVFFDRETFAALLSGEDLLGNVNARLNQGWIISAIMNHVPQAVPHENGRTVIGAVRDSLVPRFLSGKREVIMSDAFMNYTGLNVGRNTTFGISVIGEAWVNFGHWGILFMLLFGMFYGGILRGMVWYSRQYPTFVLWAPLIFLQAIKAETELVVVMNHIVKSGIFLLLAYYFSYRIMKVRI